MLRQVVRTVNKVGSGLVSNLFTLTSCKIFGNKIASCRSLQCFNFDWFFN